MPYGRPHRRGINIKRVKQGNQAEAEPRFLCQRGSPKDRLLIQVRHGFLIKIAETEEISLAPDTGAPGNVLRVARRRSRQNSSYCGALIIEHDCISQAKRAWK